MRAVTATGGDVGDSGQGPRLGSWAKAGTFVGIVAKVADGQVSLFDPAARQTATAPAGEVEHVPAGAVTVTVTVDLPLTHGLAEPDIRRWVATLTDETLREHCYAALAEAGLDEGACLPAARVNVQAMAGSGAVCLCGAKVPAPAGARLACPSCGREAVTAPPPGGPR